MQYTTLALGSLIMLFGIYTSWMSIKNPAELYKLKYMREKMGMKVGTTVHTLAYIVVPVIFGYLMIRSGIDGVTLKEFITEPHKHVFKH